MPVYEYRCEECGNRFDAFFRRPEDADEKELACSECGSGRVRKLFSVIGIGGAAEGSRSDSCGTSST